VPETLRWTAPAGAPRLDKALAEAFPRLSRARLQALIAAGHVLVDGAPARGSLRPDAGVCVEVRIPDLISSTLAPERLDVPVLFEDEHLMVVVKPAGMVVHPAPGHASGTLVHAMLGQAEGLSGIGGEERPGIVHRLDAGTSGVMVVAKSDAAHRGLSDLFRVHDIDRRYLAVVHRVPRFDRGTIRSKLARDPRDRQRFASGERGRDAVTHWEVRATADRLALLECRLETGRTHQVRVHLSEAGHPVVGDRTYARRDCVAPGAVRALAEALDHPLLHAFRLAFRHPVGGRPLAFDAEPPADFATFCAAAGLS
jgi:23S rRNA pseudouridine1911/1915/1917 synthase